MTFPAEGSAVYGAGDPTNLIYLQVRIVLDSAERYFSGAAASPGAGSPALRQKAAKRGSSL